MRVLQKRPEFLAVAQGRRASANGLNLQARNRRDDDDHIGVGFTATKKVGNAIARNRAKRRLRALASEILPTLGKPGWDYVLVARPEATNTLPFETLKGALQIALSKIHAPRN